MSTGNPPRTYLPDPMFRRPQAAVTDASHLNPNDFGLMVQSDRQHHEAPCSWIAIFEGNGPQKAALGKRIKRWWAEKNKGPHFVDLWDGKNHQQRAGAELLRMLTAWSVDSIGPFPQEPAPGTPEAVEQAAKTVRVTAKAQTPGEQRALDELMAVVDEEFGKALARVRRERDLSRLDHETSEAILAMAVARLGGEVEGRPTHRGNFLQRVDELRKVEQQRDALADALEEILPFMRGYRDDADPDDPIHERFPRWEAALRKAGRLA